MFISSKFVKGFLVITFLLLVFSNWNFQDVCKRFLYNKEQNFSQRQRFSPQTPIIINAHFCKVVSINMTLQKWAIFIMGGLWGNFSFFVGSSWNGSWLYKKRWHTSWKFQFENTSNKKVIAKKPLTNLYEMNSSAYITNTHSKHQMI